LAVQPPIELTGLLCFHSWIKKPSTERGTGVETTGRGVHSHPVDAKCVTEILRVGGDKNKEANVDVYV